MNETILRPSRRKVAVYASISLLFVVVGFLTRGEEGWFAWSGIVFFGLCFLVFVANLVPGCSLLRLSAEGFEMRSLFRSHSYRWQDIELFGVGRVGLRRMVMFNFAASFRSHAKGRAVAASLTGWQGALPDTYGLSAEALAELLNERRNAATAA
jgi:hypothetical protein